MKLLVVAVGQRQPGWADTAWDDFAKRFPPEMNRVYASAWQAFFTTQAVHEGVSPEELYKRFEPKIQALLAAQAAPARCSVVASPVSTCPPRATKSAA